MNDRARTRPILVVDDESAMRIALEVSLRELGYSVLTASDGREALHRCAGGSVGAMIVDMKMPGMTGMELYRRIRERHPHLPVILMSAFGTIEAAVDALKAGVVDYLVKPFSPETLEEAVGRALAQPADPIALPHSRTRTETILTEDPGVLKLLKMAEVVASSQATVLIEGESGTGKELLARMIHALSPRAHRPMVAVNCAAVPDNLLESELFGYEKGAFTGATSKKAGRFELANHGTILLDEISEMPLMLQAKLLRVLQEREVDPLGGKGPLPIDIRVVATTNKPLREEVRQGRFREDLYYRLNVFPLRIPPLRERPCDIPLLARHFARIGGTHFRAVPAEITPEALSILAARRWPGNVRELQNAVERALLLSEGGILRPDLLDAEGSIAPPPSAFSSTGTTLWEAERQLILDTLDQHGGNRTRTAKTLGISIRTLRNKLREYRMAGAVSSPSPSGQERREIPHDP